jgi:hypothetical protein
MKSILCCFIVLSLGVLAQNAHSQEAVIAQPGLFQDAERPVTGTVPFPDNSGFITINPLVFSGANLHNSEIFTIENFPLGSERVTLNVEQFDVLRKDSKLVLGTKNGDVPTSVPDHVLLHGSIEGMENSHVYIAVFDGYAMGYIDASADERYLIQPVALNTESPSTMIVYKESDVARPIPEGEKWQCGTEEYAPNFSKMGEISQSMAASNAPQIQSPKSVHFLSIAIDCDYLFFQANGSNSVKAQNYAIAVLGAHSDIYVRDLNCGVTAGYLRVWTTQDTYSDDGDSTKYILPLFVNYWNANMSNVTYAAALLYETHPTGGLAYVGRMCNADGYNLEYAVCGLNTGYTFPHDGYVWDVDVSAHEFGHICGSLHTFNCSWNPPIDSCYPSEGGQCYAGTVVRKGTIMSYCHLTSAGTDLKFHPRVAAFLQDRFNNSSITPCAATVQVPAANAGPDKNVCAGGSVAIGSNATGGVPPLTYSWRPSTGLNVTNTATVQASPTKNTTYIVTATDANLMRSYDTVAVTVQRPIPPVITAVKDTLFSSTAVSYQWYLETQLINGATGQKYVPTQTGNYTVSTVNQFGCDTISKPYLFTVKSGVALQGRTGSAVRIYPNPALNLLTFDYTAAGDVVLELSISDVFGNTVYCYSRKAGENSSPLSIDLTSFTQGTYFLHYTLAGISSTAKFIKE